MDDFQIHQREFFFVLLRERNRVVLHFNGVHRTPKCLHRHLNGNRAAAGANIVGNCSLGQPQFGQRNAANLRLGHGNFIPLKSVVLQAMRNHKTSAVRILNQHDAQRIIFMFDQFLRTSGTDFFVGIAKLFTDMNRQMIESRRTEPLKRILCTVCTAQQRKHCSIPAHFADQVALSAVQADGTHIFP